MNFHGLAFGTVGLIQFCLNSEFSMSLFILRETLVTKEAKGKISLVVMQNCIWKKQMEELFCSSEGYPFVSQTEH